MAEAVSYEVSEREYEAIMVLRDVIILVADEMRRNLGYDSPGLESIRSCAMDEALKAELGLAFE